MISITIGKDWYNKKTIKAVTAPVNQKISAKVA